MATTGQQAGFAASRGLNWADPSDPNFGKAGYTGQSDYDAYNQQYGTTPSTGTAPDPSAAPTKVTPSTGSGIPDAAAPSTGYDTATHAPVGNIGGPIATGPVTHAPVGQPTTATGPVTNPPVGGSPASTSPAPAAGGTASDGTPLAAGWQADPSMPGWVMNPTTGQRLPTNNGYYQSLLTPAAGTSPATPAPPAPTTTPAAPTTGPGTAGTTGGATTQDLTNTYTDTLNKLLQTDSSAPSMSDSTLAAQQNAFDVQNQRGLDQSRAAMAEQLAAEGLAPTTGGSSGAFDSGLANLTQQAGEASAGNAAQLMGTELQSRRNQLQALAATAGSSLTADQQQAIEEELGKLDAQIQQQAVTQQGKLGQGSLDLQQLLGQGSLNLQQLLGEGGLNLGLLQLLTNNQNYNSGLATNLGEFNANMNQQALLQALGLS